MFQPPPEEKELLDPAYTKMTDDLVLFFREGSPFSNFHPAKFVINGHSFTCTEQFYHSKKADHFGDKQSRRQILRTSNPKTHYAIGHNVKGYNQRQWQKGPAWEIMLEANLAKYSQNPHLLKALLDTDKRQMAEGSATDFTWGIGIDINDPHAFDTENWEGKNWMGKILMEVRERLKDHVSSVDEINQVNNLIFCHTKSMPIML